MDRRLSFSVMNGDAWRIALIVLLVLNASLGLGYRIFRLTKGGPLGDVIGQAALAVVLAATAAGVSAGWDVARWIAVVYSALFALVVMPLWTLAVLVPMRPERIDLAFAIGYWVALIGILVAALSL